MLGILRLEGFNALLVIVSEVIIEVVGTDVIVIVDISVVLMLSIIMMITYDVYDTNDINKNRRGTNEELDVNERKLRKRIQIKQNEKINNEKSKSRVKKEIIQSITAK